MSKQEGGLLDKIYAVGREDSAEVKVAEKYKVAVPCPPEEVFSFPTDVTACTIDQIGRLLGNYDQEAGWIRYLMALNETRLLEARHLVSVFKKQLYLERRVTDSQQDANAWVEIDINSLRAQAKLNELEQERIILEARLDIFARYASSISREISRRKNDSFADSKGTKSDIPLLDRQKDRVAKIKGKDLRTKKKV